jgi:hypothetical protein
MILLLLFVAGVALMVPFESTVTRILGLAALFAFVVYGVFLVATPAYLDQSDE